MKRKFEKDGQQFHHYQQPDQPPHTSNHWIQKTPQHMQTDIKVLAWDRHKDVA
jgi:hypothetical protein